MDRITTQDKLCMLVTYVGVKKYRNRYAHDCFCEDSRHSNHNPQIDDKIVAYICGVVEESLKTKKR